MDLLPTSEQQQIIDSTAAFIGDRLPLQRLKGLPPRAETLSDETWRQIIDLGWLGLGLDAAAGGVGYGPSEEVLLFRELGRVVAPPRILFTVVAAHAAVAAGDPALAERLARGGAPVALAVREDFESPSGSIGKRRLYEAEGAAVALAIDGDHVWLIDITGGEFPPRPCLDSSISMSVADLAGERVLCHVTDAAIGLRGALLLAAYQVGIAQTALEMIVGYAKIRQTFGRPIGAYQAVRHPCAEMAARAEEAKGQVFLASVTLADGAADAALQISAARVLAEKAALQNADENIQLHGGIGVTEEFDAHHLIKRANVAPQWFGDRRSHLARVLQTPFSLEVAQ
jgi:alkylation response protein AidB-like acyl-CoA dehydrogenase